MFHLGRIGQAQSLPVELNFGSSPSTNLAGVEDAAFWRHTKQLIEASLLFAESFHCVFDGEVYGAGSVIPI
jgi:hypothetical protein